MTTPTVTIKPSRDKPIRNQHPWIFSGAIANVQNATDGDIVSVYSSKGRLLGRGYWNHRSQIQVRMLTWQDEEINTHWWRRMLKRSIDARLGYHHNSNKHSQVAYRLINAENDYAPGLVVDRYGEYLVLQALTLYIDQNKQMISTLLADLMASIGQPIKGIFERSDVETRKKEGLELKTGLLWGEQPPDLVNIRNDFCYYVDIRNGHKTGHYLDQIENQKFLFELLNRYFANEALRILNLFSYTGGFSISALRIPTTHVTNIDSSHEAMELAEKNILLNKFNTTNYECIQADAFDYLRYCVTEGEKFDVIILDPPKFAQNKQQVDRAARGYKDLNLNAFKLIKPNGLLMTFSCSGAISPDLFQKIVFGALADSGRQAQIIKQLGPGSDHPIALTFPEGAYLKGLLVRVY